MGADFSEKTTPTFKKCWDTGRLDLVTEDLFRRLPTVKTRSFAAEICGSAVLQKGDKITVDKIGNALVATRGHAELARSENSPAELLEAIEAHCGVAQGVIDEVHELAGIVEISICIDHRQ
jgi:hypothetical protein